MYFILGADSKYTLTQYLDWLNQQECDFPFYQEEPWVKDKSLEIILSLEESQESRLSDYFFCGPLMILSERFYQLLKKYSEQIEFVPVLLLCGEMEFNFYALHVMEQLDAIDESLSKYAGVKYGMYAGITCLVLKDEVISRSSVFLLKKTFSPIVVFGEEIVKESRELGLKGMTFTPVYEYKEDTRGI